MAIKVKPIADVVAKWAQNAAAAQTYYSSGVAGAAQEIRASIAFSRPPDQTGRGPDKNRGTSQQSPSQTTPGPA